MQSVGKAGTLFGKRVALLPPGPPIRLPKTVMLKGRAEETGCRVPDRPGTIQRAV